MTVSTVAPIVLNADDKAVKALVTNIRAAVKSGALYAAYVAEHGVTRATVAPHAAALALLAFPVKGDAAPVQKKDGIRTPYGNAVQAAGAGLRRALPAEDADTSDTDYLAAVVKAALAASEHAVDSDTILAAIADALA